MPYADPEVRRQKHKEYSRRYYEKNREAIIAKTSHSKIEQRKKWTAFKSTLKCINCGYSHPAALDFHHVILGPDNIKVHRLLANQAYERIMEEIKKCVVLCANCHRIHHHEERLAIRRKRKKKQLKQG